MAPSPDPTQALFRPHRIVEVEVEMAVEDWQALRAQTRTMFDVLGPDCLDRPISSPYTWFRAAATIDGQRVEPVGIRKRGLLGSVSRSRPSLRLKANHYLRGGTFSGLERMSLNNAKQDPSLVRQCLSYSIFRAAGVPTPRCNFASVTVNGQDLGLYVHVETVKKQFLGRHFARTGGNLYAGTLSDFRPQWLDTFERNVSRKGTLAAMDRSDLEAIADALQVEDAGLVETLEPLVDLDSFITFWAVEVLLAHGDGYAGNTNNFHIYADPSDRRRFHFLPWGVDTTLGSHSLGHETPPSVYAHGFLARRLYLLPETRAAYVERLRSLLDDVWDEEALLAEVDRMETLVRPEVGTAEEFDASLNEVRQFVRNRRTEVMADLDAEWPFAPRNPPCARRIGTVLATLSTSWGTLADPDPLATGTGTLEVTLGGKGQDVIRVGGSAGLSASGEDPPQALVQLVALRADGTLLFLLAQMSADHIVSETSLPIDADVVFAWVGAFDPNGGDPAQLIGWIGDGTLTFARASTLQGAPVKLALTGTLFQMGF